MRAIGGVATLEVVPCFQIHKFVSNLGDLANPGRPSLANPESRNDRIFHALCRDGRQSNREVSRQLDISEGAIRQRLKALQQSGEMQFQVVCNPLALDLGTAAVLRISTTAKEAGKVLERITDLEAAAFVAEAAGVSNVIALFITPDNQSLGDVTGQSANVDARGAQGRRADTGHQHQARVLPQPFRGPGAHSPKEMSLNALHQF